MLTHADWQDVPGLRHGFLDGRESTTAPTWPAVLTGIGLEQRIAVPHQVHGADVVDAPEGDARPKVDGLVAARPGVLVGIVTADCVPVLLLDRARRVAAAVHAGWRGAALGVLETAVGRFVDAHGSVAGEIEAAIGPAISGCCYEVGPEVRDAFRARTGDTTSTAWERRGERFHVDLRSAAQLLLARAGVTRATVLGPCTVCGTGYHSYRRDGAGTGRQLSFVGWA